MSIRHLKFFRQIAQGRLAGASRAGPPTARRCWSRQAEPNTPGHHYPGCRGDAVMRCTAAAQMSGRNRRSDRTPSALARRRRRPAIEDGGRAVRAGFQTSGVTFVRVVAEPSRHPIIPAPCFQISGAPRQAGLRDRIRIQSDPKSRSGHSCAASRPGAQR
jgi:hypothetical protein